MIDFGDVTLVYDDNKIWLDFSDVTLMYDDNTKSSILVMYLGWIMQPSLKILENHTTSPKNSWKIT